MISALLYEQDQVAFLHAVDPNPLYGGRMTLISPEGELLYDTFVQSITAEMRETPHDRPEIEDAMEQGVGVSVRYSETMEQFMIYHAQRMEDGSVLRLSMFMRGINDGFWQTLSALLPVTLCVCLLCWWLARKMTSRIVEPINAIDLDVPLSNNVYEELTPLISRLETQRQRIDEQIREMDAKRMEFNLAMEHMQEGFMVLDHDRKVLTINNSAQRIFHVEEKSVLGKHVFYCNDSQAMRGLMTRSHSNNYCDAIYREESSGKEYFLMCDPIKQHEEVSGLVITILDITFARETERMRREFSANVSHELKTPLTSISGYAEIMMNGIVKLEDVQSFASRIYNESNRLYSLIQGVIFLSKLDDSGDALPFEEVDLYEIAHHIMAQFMEVAETNRLHLALEGESARMLGIPDLLEETLSNLIENAIWYNRPGGNVAVQIVNQEKTITLRVVDTGMGIEQEYLTRVFDRFYRTDRGRAKNLHGTGLGLAIVHHCARLHDAQIDVQSQVGQGTTVEIVFKKLLDET